VENLLTRKFCLFEKILWRCCGSFTFYPQLGRAFQIWLYNAGAYNINVWGILEDVLEGGGIA
jgi:hypothetical protein